MDLHTIYLLAVGFGLLYGLGRWLLRLLISGPAKTALVTKDAPLHWRTDWVREVRSGAALTVGCLLYVVVFVRLVVWLHEVGLLPALSGF